MKFSIDPVVHFIDIQDIETKRFEPELFPKMVNILADVTNVKDVTSNVNTFTFAFLSPMKPTWRQRES